MNLPASILTKTQTKTFGPKIYTENGQTYKLTVKIRYDDDCGNGHNSFSITGAQYRKNKRGLWEEDSFGCMHDTIAKHFPDLAPYIKWHLTSSDGPWGYIANTIYFAGDRDHWGLRKGEASTSPVHQEDWIRFSSCPISHKLGKRFCEFLQAALAFNRTVPKTNPNYVTFEPVPVPHVNRPGDTYKYKDQYTFKGFACTWGSCPFDSLQEAQEWQAALLSPVEFFTVPTLFGEGKERELDMARHAAVWPEATDEELIAPGLKERLEARLPKLMEEFKVAVESLGFVY